MSDLLLGSDGDLADLVKNDLQMATGLQAVGQGAMIRLRFIKKECDLDPTLGTIDFDVFLGVGTDIVRAASVRASLLASPGILSVDSLSVVTDPQTGDVDIDCEATGTDGELTLNTTVVSP